MRHRPQRLPDGYDSQAVGASPAKRRFCRQVRTADCSTVEDDWGRPGMFTGGIARFQLRVRWVHPKGSLTQAILGVEQSARPSTITQIEHWSLNSRQSGSLLMNSAILSFAEARSLARGLAVVINMTATALINPRNSLVVIRFSRPLLSRHDGRREECNPVHVANSPASTSGGHLSEIATAFQRDQPPASIGLVACTGTCSSAKACHPKAGGCVGYQASGFRHQRPIYRNRPRCGAMVPRRNHNGNL